MKYIAGPVNALNLTMLEAVQIAEDNGVIITNAPARHALTEKGTSHDPISQNLSERSHRCRMEYPRASAPSRDTRWQASPLRSGREIINAIQYVLRSGCAWRMIPHDLPHWESAY